MSNSSTTIPHERTSWLSKMTHRHGVQIVTAPLRFVGFWAAVALPFLYLPLLYGGLQGHEVTVFLGLLALNALSIVAGHGYGR